MASFSEQIPVIDVRHALDDRVTRAALDRACREWGFFQVVGHGIPQALLDAMQRSMRELFALPAGEKRAIERTAVNAWGYYDRELTKNARDWKEIFDVGPAVLDGPLAGNVPQWPARLPGFRATVLAHAAACERLAWRLLAAIGTNLGAPAGLLRAAFRPRHTSFLRLNHYPRCADPASPDAPTMPTDGHLGVHHHTDAGVLTLLLQDDQPGLQVLHDGRWCLVEPRADALVVNVGDVVQVWSNDRYRAALHRVLANRDAERYSAPFFLNPAAEATYAPLPEICSEADPPRYRPIQWGAFRTARAAGDYADRGEEIQISHFRCGLRPARSVPRRPCVARAGSA
jgi:isopenicillin N synthase-like dioxygenase